MNKPDRVGDDSAREALRAFGEQILKTQESIRQALVQTTAPSAAWLDRLTKQIEANRKALIEPALRFAEQAREALRYALPVNWRDLQPGELGEVLALAQTGVVALVWAPRAEITTKLAAAQSQAEREQILSSNRREILADVAAALSDSAITLIPEQDEAQDQADEALRAAQSGFDRSAQTLFASALGHILEGSLGFERPGQAFKKFKDRDLDEVGVTELRIVCLQLATVNALTDTDQDPDGFNRHGTQHGDPAFFSEAAMLGAALLIAGWIRELSWLAEHRPDIFKTA